MQRLLDAGVMKATVIGGVVHCSYRSVTVGEEHENERVAELERASLFVSTCLLRLDALCVSVCVCVPLC